VEVIIRGLIPRVWIDGFNENQIEAESAGENEHCVGVTLVVSRYFSRIVKSSSEILSVFRKIWKCLRAWTLKC